MIANEQQKDSYVIERLGGTEERRIKCTRCGVASAPFILNDILDSVAVPDDWQPLVVDVQNERWQQHPPVIDFTSNHRCS